jgi:hypothetical protein
MGRVAATAWLSRRARLVGGSAISNRDFGGFVRQILVSTAWATTAVFLGVVVGLASIILPPAGAFGFVAVAGAILLWAAPDLSLVREETIRRFLLVSMVVILCVPSYYALVVPGLPQISIRRIVLFPFIVLYLLYIASSAQARAHVVYVIEHAKTISIGVVGFLVMIFLSIITSVSFAYSLSDATNAVLTWFLPFFAAASIYKTDRDLMYILRIIAICAICVALLGIVEVPLEKNLMVQIMPESMYEGLISDPSFQRMLEGQYRNGLYRAPSVFGVALSFGEFEAFVAPLGAFFFLFGRGALDRLLGFSVVVTSVLGIWASGSRGANLSLIVAIVVFIALWIARERRFNPRGLLAPMIVTLAVAGFGALFALTMVSHRAHDMVFGAEDDLSTQARFNEMDLAMPQILANPITGHGLATSGSVIGYGSNREGYTVDSYPLSLMVETGVPSLVFFVMMIGGSIWTSARAYLGDPSQRGAINGAFASALAAFAIYRMALSQRENHSLVFIVCGMIAASAAINRASVREPKLPEQRNRSRSKREGPA